MTFQAFGMAANLQHLARKNKQKIEIAELKKLGSWKNFMLKRCLAG